MHNHCTPTANVRAEKRQYSVPVLAVSSGLGADLEELPDAVVVMHMSHTGARRRERYRHRPRCAEDQLGSGLGFTALGCVWCVAGKVSVG